MYTVYADDNLIYNLNNEELVLVSPKLTLEESSAGSFEFTILPTHPYYDTITDLQTVVTVYQDDEEIFSGIPTEHSEDFYKRRTFYIKGELSYLSHTTQPMAEFHDYTVRGFLETLLNVHNSKVAESRQFKVGIVTVTDNNDSLYRYTNFENTLEAINNKLVEKLGGYLRVRKADGVRYLDYLADSPKTSNQVIQFGENLMDFTKDFDTSDVCTVIIPQGARLDESPISALDAYLDITSVNDGKNYLVNEEAVKKYGWIELVVKWDDVNVASILKTKAQKYLNEVQYEPQTLEIKAIDLHNLDVDTDAIRILDMVRAVSKPHGLDKTFMVTKREIPLNNPSEEEFTFGTQVRSSLTDETRKENTDLSSKIQTLPTKNEILNEAKENATQLIHDATHGHVVTTANEQLIMDTDDVETATKLWRWNMGGLGYSKNGYNGAYETAITMDGQIVGERVTANSISASQLNIEYTSSVEKKISTAETNAVSTANSDTDKKLGNYWTSDETSTKLDETLDSANTSTDEKLEDYWTIEETTTKLSVTKEEINTEVSKKVGKSEVISAINQSAEAISIKANKISLEGVVTANSNFKILEDGSMVATNGSFSGNITGSTINLSGGDYYSKLTSDGLEVKTQDTGNGYALVTVNKYGFNVDDTNYHDDIYSNGGQISLDPNGIKFNGLNAKNKYTGYNFGRTTLTQAGMVIINDGNSSTLREGVKSQLNVGYSTGASSQNMYSPIRYKEDSESLTWYAVMVDGSFNRMRFLQSSSTYIEFQTLGTAYGITVWSSDRNLKKDIKDSSISGCEAVKKFKHRDFLWNDHEGHELCGYVAQEMEEIDPNMVVKINQSDDESGNPREPMYQINESVVVPYISKALQELIERVEKLENE